ncbi:MAG: anti-sigma factor [Motilibacteraceae bacterium]
MRETTATAAGQAAGGGPAQDRVEVRLPAASAYLSVLRTATAGLAARLDFTLDEIEDLRIAVDEACAMLLPQAVEGAPLTCTFELGDAAGADVLALTVSVPTRAARLPERDTFAWTVLSALAGDVDAGTTDGAGDGATGESAGDTPGTVWISLRKHRGAGGA